MGIGRNCQKPNDEILAFMSHLTLKNEDSRKELELIRHKWQV